MKIDRQCYLNKLAIYLCEKVFPHIHVDSLQAVKVSSISEFKREDLGSKRWTTIKTFVTKVGQSALKITQDSELIIVKDAKKAK